MQMYTLVIFPMLTSTVQPNPISIELSQYTEPLTRKLQDVEDRVGNSYCFFFFVGST